MKRWVAGIRAERRRKAMEEDFDSMYKRDHITSITVRERRSVVLCRVVGENAKSKEVCDDVGIDPVALLVLMTNNQLARDVASDLLDDHNGNVQAAHRAWITAQSVRHTHGANSEGESSGHARVQYGASTGPPQARVDQAQEIINERGGLSAPVESEIGAQPSDREKMCRTAKTGNKAVRGTGGNTHHGPLFGHPDSIARSEVRAFEV